MPKPLPARHTILYSALHRIFAAQHAASLFASGLLLFNLPVRAEEVSHTEWDCRGNDTNTGWICREIAMPGREYRRPAHAESAVSPNQEEGPRIRLARNLDWVDIAELSDSERELVAPGCCGAYVEPPMDYPDAELSPEEAPLRVSAATTEVDQEQVAKLTGEVHVTQGNRQIRSQRALVDQKNRKVSLEGAVQFREPGLLLSGDKAEINLDDKVVQLDNASFVFQPQAIRGTAKKLYRNEENLIQIDEATYTTCEPGNDTWLLASSKIELDPNKNQGTAHNVRLHLKDVPVMYIPWLQFPFGEERTTGLLFPHIGFHSGSGMDFELPVYLNLAPNYDATVVPRRVAKHGYMMELEARHLSHWEETTASGGYLWDDDGGDDEDDILDEFGRRPHEGEDRWSVYVDHKGGLGESWDTRIDYSEISDNDYLDDLGNTSLDVTSQTHLRQLIGAGYSLDNWQFGMKAIKYQTIIDFHPDQYEQLPQLEARGYYRFDETDLILELKNQYVNFDHSDEDVVTGQRVRLDYSLTWDKSWLWGFFKPSVKLKHLTYNLDKSLQPGGDDRPSVSVPMAILDTGLIFERDTSWFSGYWQTFEPRLYLLYAAEKNQSDIPDFDTDIPTFSYNQLFRDNRFVGGDRIGDARQISLGITSRLIDDTTLRERFRFSIGQIYYLEDRSVSLGSELENLRDNQSDLITEVATSLSQHWRMQGDILWNIHSGRIDRGSVGVHHKDSDNRIYNLAYRYTRREPDLLENDAVLDNTIEQIDLSSYLPLFGNYALALRLNYDLNHSRELEMFAGLEYNSCCWRIGLMARSVIERDDNLDPVLLARDGLDHDKGIFLHVQFKGLAGLGAKIDNILSEGIYGYNPPQK